MKKTTGKLLDAHPSDLATRPFHQLLGHTLEHDFQWIKLCSPSHLLQPQLHPTVLLLHQQTQTSPAISRKDLGVITSNDLSWTEHYHRITSCSYMSLHLFQRSFTTNSVSGIWQLYFSLDLSHLAYCSPLRRLNFIKCIIFLEKVQRCATKFILNDYSSNYKYRLLTLHILPLMYSILNWWLNFFYQQPKRTWHSFQHQKSCHGFWLQDRRIII